MGGGAGYQPQQSAGMWAPSLAGEKEPARQRPRAKVLQERGQRVQSPAGEVLTYLRSRKPATGRLARKAGAGQHGLEATRGIGLPLHLQQEAAAGFLSGRVT